MFEIKAAQLKVGDVFTTEADRGEVWFQVVEVKRHAKLLDVLGRVTSTNPGTDYAVGDSEWMDLGNSETVTIK